MKEAVATPRTVCAQPVGGTVLDRLSRSNHEVDVLVVGAGPVGLSHALWLQQQGAEPLVIEARSVPRRDEWCALSTDALRLLDQLGVLDAIEAESNRFRGIVVHQGHAQSARLESFDDSGAELALARRSVVESALEQTAAARAIPIERNHRLQKLDVKLSRSVAAVQKLEEVSVGYATSHMESVVAATHEITARHVIGCDGRRSIVRRDLGVGYTAFAPPRVAAACLVEVNIQPEPADWVHVMLAPGTVDLIWPLAPKHVLWVTEWTPDTVPDGVEIDTQISLSVDPIQRGQVSDGCLERGLERTHLDVAEVKHRHALRFQPSRVSSAGSGQTWLSGAAAQVVSPILGMDDAVGLYEVKGLALLLGFGTDGATGAPALTARQYEQRRLALQHRALNRDGAALAAPAEARHRIDPVLSYLPLVELPAH